MPKKKRPAGKSGGGSSQPRESSRLAGLARAEALVARKQWGEARDLLESLAQRYPNDEDVLGELANLYIDIKEIKGYERVVERLLRIHPDDPDLMMGLAGAYMTNFRPALAVRALRRFLARWPDHPRADDACKTLAELEPKVEEMLT